MYLKACLSKELSEVCSHDSLQEPPQRDDVSMTSCPGSRRQHISVTLPGYHVTSCDIMWGHVTSHNIMWDHVRSCEIMWGHVRSCEVMWALYLRDFLTVPVSQTTINSTTKCHQNARVWGGGGGGGERGTENRETQAENHHIQSWGSVMRPWCLSSGMLLAAPQTFSPTLAPHVTNGVLRRHGCKDALSN